jgi:hypothetical protein
MSVANTTMTIASDAQKHVANVQKHAVTWLLKNVRKPSRTNFDLLGFFTVHFFS